MAGQAESVGMTLEALKLDLRPFAPGRERTADREDGDADEVQDVEVHTGKLPGAAG